VNLALPENRVAVKICGVTRRDDALAAMESGADLLGFNTWRGSPRYLDLGAHAGWLAELPVVRVALLVNAALPEAERIAALPYVDALQLHGDEDAAFCAALARAGKPLIKALRVREAAHFAEANRFSTPHLLLDARVDNAYGGTGSRVDVGLVRKFTVQFPELTLWLAGGLVAGNVAEAIRAVRPRVVDVSSGVESAPGRKDSSMVRAFCEAAQTA
jgi:phosphoribosylanthranilate isomerase